MPFTPFPDQTNAATMLSTPQPQQKSVGGFLSNLAKSGVNTVKDVGSAAINVVNPNMEKNTIANLARLGIGAGELLIPGEQGAEKYARSVGDFYNQRYGISDIVKGDFGSAGSKIGETLYNDPVGAALDVSTIATGVGGAAKAAGSASKIGTLTKAGEIASRVGEITDPLKILSNVGSKVTGGKVSKAVRGAGESMKEIGEDVSTQALKSTPKQMEVFEYKTGKPLAEFIKENNLFGSGKSAAKKVEDLIDPLQKEYNSLTRTVKEIDPLDYAIALDNKIKEIRSTDFSTEAEAVAKNLEARRDLFLNRSEKAGGKIPLKTLTDTKSSAFSKVPEGAMIDPTVEHAGKVAGDVAIELIDGYAPGSREVGRRLRDLRAFQEIANSKKYIGKGTQLFNMLKPSGAGALLGGIVGTAVGQPILGMAAGGVANAVLNAPSSLSLISKIANKTGGAVERLPEILKPGQKVGMIENITKAGRLGVPTTNPQPQKDQNQSNLIDVHAPIIPPQSITTSTPATKSGFKEITTDQLGQILLSPNISAKTKEYVKTIYELQQKQVAASTKAVEKERGATSAIDMMQKLYGVGTPQSLSMGDKTTLLGGGVQARGNVEIKKLSDQNYVDRLNAYNTQRALVAGPINIAAGAGVLNGGEYQRLAMEAFPNEYTSEKVADAWFRNAREVLLNAKNQEGLQQIFSQAMSANQ